MSFNMNQAIELLKKNAGNVSATCKAMNINRDTFYTYKKKHPKFADAIEEAQESLKDFAESQLFTLIHGGKTVYEESKDVILPNGTVTTLRHTKTTKRPPDTTAIIFFLKTRCKERGYVENAQNSNPDTPKPFSDIPESVKATLLKAEAENE